MTGIIMPSGKLIGPDALFVRHRHARNDIDVELATPQVEGFYKMQIRRADGSLRLETPWFKNLILDAGLDRWLSNGQYAYYTSGGFKVGTNSTAPAVGQTTLLNRVANCGSNSASAGADVPTTSGGATWWVARRYGGRFDAGSLNGQALAEVGVGWDSTSCFSRALILPDGINPGTITVLIDETLEVYYEVRVYPVTADTTGSITLAGTSHDFTLRPTNIGQTTGSSHAQAIGSGNSNDFGKANAFSAVATPDGSLGAITAGVTGGSSSVISSVTSWAANSYTSGSFSRTHSMTFGLDRLNTSGGNIKTLMYYISLVGAFQAAFNPVIPKGPTKTLRLDFTTTLARRP